MTPNVELIDRLRADGFVEARDGGLRTTRRWQAAMMRALARLIAQHERGEDLRVPIAHVLLEVYGERLDDKQIADLVEVFVELESPLRSKP